MRLQLIDPDRRIAAGKAEHPRLVLAERGRHASQSRGYGTPIGVIADESNSLSASMCCEVDEPEPRILSRRHVLERARRGCGKELGLRAKSSIVKNRSYYLTFRDYAAVDLVVAR